jgi:8-oxo-dGTP pyrophosphatase MutT (NUDIX family)
MLGMRRPARDMAPEKLDLLGQLFSQWIAEEKAEPEHTNTDQLPHAAGTMMMTKDGKALFVRRAAGRDHAGHWSIPAGMTEDDEMPWQTAMRETNEEVGDCGMEPRGMRLMDHRLMDNVGFTTYGYPVDSEFKPTLDEEHDAYMWSPIGNAPHPLHPGLEATLKDYTQDPLTDKGSKIMEAMKKQYGPEKGEQVFYASKNKGNIKGVDGGTSEGAKRGWQSRGHGGSSGGGDMPSRSEAEQHVRTIKQHMANKGIVRPDVATAHLQEPMKSAVIHGIVHGTNTLGFHEKTRHGDSATDEGGEVPLEERFSLTPDGNKVIDKHSGMSYNIDDIGRILFSPDSMDTTAGVSKPNEVNVNKPTVETANWRPPKFGVRQTQNDDSGGGYSWRTPRYGRDAGTSEGARKAAETRKAHHSAQHEELTSAGFEHKESNPSSSTYEKAPREGDYHQRGQVMSVHHYPKSGKTWMWTHSGKSAEGRAGVKIGEGKTGKTLSEHLQRHRNASHGQDNGMWRAPSYGRDAGTSEGAKKAAQTRKQHEGLREGAQRLKTDPRIVEIKHPRTGHVIRTNYVQKRVPVRHPRTGHIIFDPR